MFDSVLSEKVNVRGYKYLCHPNCHQLAVMRCRWRMKDEAFINENGFRVRNRHYLVSCGLA